MIELSDEQKHAAETDEMCLVEAGPGSGKTLTLVHRFEIMAGRSRDSKGIALISFTNAAVNEAKHKCNSDLLNFPNYMGTFDSFINKYLITPYFCRKKGSQKPEYLADWSEIDKTTIRCTNRPGVGVSLNSFRQSETALSANKGAMKREEKKYWQDLNETEQSQLVETAEKRLSSLTERGIFTSESARHYAIGVLQDKGEIALSIKQSLGLRFKEIIVDEFQDCSGHDVTIVELFKKTGMHITVAADPDQMIYEFRDASVERYACYKERIPKKLRCSLSENHRSSYPICGAINAFRVIGGNITSAAKRGDEIPVYIIQGDDKATLAFFRSLLRQYGISNGDSRVLAYKKKRAAELAGKSLFSNSSQSKTYQILKSVGVLLDSDSYDERHKAILACRPAILGMVNIPVEVAKETVSSQMEKTGLTDEIISLLLLRLAEKTTKLSNAKEATACIRSVVAETLKRELDELNLKNANTTYRLLKDKLWNEWHNHMVSPSNQCVPKNIHAVKGEEFRAVLLDLSLQEEMLNQVMKTPNKIESNDELRVFYVGLSRAKELLAIHCKTAEEGLLLEKIFNDRNVYYEYKKA
jgi:superfamily I DNA/RNA helicase